MAVLLGLLVAASFGSGDFLGGRASRRAPALTVLLVAQTAAVAGAAVVCVFVGGRVGTRDIVYGSLAGSLNVVGIGLLYRGLAAGRMSVVAPLTAVVASLVPVVWGVARGERPSAVIFVGVLCALSAGVLIARTPGDGEKVLLRDSAAVWALYAGACLGTSLILYAQTSTDSGLWPVFAARIAALALVALALVVVAARKKPLPFPTGPDRTLAIGAGTLDVTASTLLLLAVRRGLIVVVAPVAALAPAATVLLARVVLGEQLRSVQRVGLALALIGVVMIVAG
jgi:drug/metabolite transporter (DMT)-like permease